MKIQLNLNNGLTVQSGGINGGYVVWSLYGESPHQRVELSNATPTFKIREVGETNYAGYIKLPSLMAGTEFNFKITLTFSNTTLKFPLMDFNFNAYPKSLIFPYCRTAKYWEINDPELIEIAENLVFEAGDDVPTYLHGAFQFVRDNIKFRENLDQRLGARLALKDGKGDCDEFSDLFITLCRISHIPARRVMGVLLTDAQNHSLHAWSEVYIPLYEQWVPFDVALDEFSSIRWNYLARVHNGLSSEAPLLRLKSKADKNFKAKFAENDIAQLSLLNA